MSQKNTYDHLMRPAHAIAYGVNEALFLRRLIHVLEHNVENGKHVHPVPQGSGDISYEDIAGQPRTWRYDTVKAMQGLHPYWSQDQLRRVIESLHKQGVILKGKFNRYAWDHTVWYALRDESMVGIDNPEEFYSRPAESPDGFSGPELGVSETTNGFRDSAESIPQKPDKRYRDSAEPTSCKIPVTRNKTLKEESTAQLGNKTPRLSSSGVPAIGPVSGFDPDAPDPVTDPLPEPLPDSDSDAGLDGAREWPPAPAGGTETRVSPQARPLTPPAPSPSLYAEIDGDGAPGCQDSTTQTPAKRPPARRRHHQGQAAPAVSADISIDADPAVFAYIERFQRRHRGLPGLSRADKERLVSLASELGDEFPALLDTYFVTREAFIIDHCHPVGLLWKQKTAWLARCRKPKTLEDICRVEIAAQYETEKELKAMGLL